MIRLGDEMWRLELVRVDLNSEESCWEAFRSNRSVGFLVLVAILLGGLSQGPASGPALQLLPEERDLRP